MVDPHLETHFRTLGIFFTKFGKSFTKFGISFIKFDTSHPIAFGNLILSP